MGAPARCRSCVGAARQHVTTRPGARAATAIDGRRRRVERDHATDGRAGGGGGARESNGVRVKRRAVLSTDRDSFLFFSAPRRLVLLFMRLVLVNVAAKKFHYRYRVGSWHVRAPRVVSLHVTDASWSRGMEWSAAMDRRCRKLAEAGTQQRRRGNTDR